MCVCWEGGRYLGGGCLDTNERDTAALPVNAMREKDCKTAQGVEKREGEVAAMIVIRTRTRTPTNAEARAEGIHSHR